MHSKLAIALLASAVAACNHTPMDLPDRGVSAVNVPTVEPLNTLLPLLVIRLM